MTLCKVLLSGLKPSDVNCSSNNIISEIPLEHQQDQSMFATSLLETDYLNLHIKPMARSTNSVRKCIYFLSLTSTTDQF